jgi:hypothetical protein
LLILGELPFPDIKAKGSWLETIRQVVATKLKKQSSTREWVAMKKHALLSS